MGGARVELESGEYSLPCTALRLTFFLVTFDASGRWQMEDQYALSGSLGSVHGEERKMVLSLLHADSCSPPLAAGYGLFSHQVASQFSVDSNRGPLKDNSEMSTRTQCQALKIKSSVPRTHSQIHSR